MAKKVWIYSKKEKKIPFNKERNQEKNGFESALKCNGSNGIE